MSSPYVTDWRWLRRSPTALQTLKRIGEEDAKLIDLRTVEFANGDRAHVYNLIYCNFAEVDEQDGESFVGLTPDGRKAVDGTTGWPQERDVSKTSQEEE